MSDDKISVDALIERLIQIESHVHYCEPPPPGAESFVVIAHDSPVLISAPHGTRTFRNGGGETWHEEDEYTAGIALLLAEYLGVSAIANVWRDDKRDPNYYNDCVYKEGMKQLVEGRKIRFVIDLHGAREDHPRMKDALVDLGSLNDGRALDAAHRDVLNAALCRVFGEKATSLNVFPAEKSDTVTKYCHDILGIQALQVEMKPSVRVPVRRTDASAFAKLGPYSAPPGGVWKMLGVLETFIRHLEKLK